MTLWISRDELLKLPIDTPAYVRVKAAANQLRKSNHPDLSDNNTPHDTNTLAAAYVAVREGSSDHYGLVNDALAKLPKAQTRYVLEIARSLSAYIIAAELIGIGRGGPFGQWLTEIVQRPLRGHGGAGSSGLIGTSKHSTNNWGTHARKSLLMAGAYLGRSDWVKIAADAHRCWLGTSSAPNELRYTKTTWHADPTSPRGINRAKATITRNGKKYNVDGLLPEEMRRAASGFTYPFPKENYCYEAMEGAIVTQVVLHRLGKSYALKDGQAILLAYRWLHEQAKFPPEGDDTWQPWVLNYYWGTSYKTGPARAGKGIGFTDFSHAK